MGDKITPSPFNGFYVGAGLVGVNVDNYVVMKERNLAVGTNNLTLEGNTGFFSGGGRVNIGYGRLVDQGYVAAEVAYRYAPAGGGSVRSLGSKIIGYNFPYDNSDAPNDFSINTRGGYMFHSGMVAYALMGYDITQFRPHFFDTNEVFHGTSEWLSGITPGAGIEFVLSPSVTIDARYMYSIYCSSTRTVSNTDTSGGINHTTIKIQPTIQTANLTINYHFN